MADFRHVYFSFHYDDVVLTEQIRNSGQFSNRGKSFNDAADREKLKRSDNTTIRRWIREQMEGTSVTIVLIGEETANREWVRFEIEESVREEKGLLGIYLDQCTGFGLLRHFYPRTRGPNPFASFPARGQISGPSLDGGLLGLRRRPPTTPLGGLLGVGFEQPVSMATMGLDTGGLFGLRRPASAKPSMATMGLEQGIIRSLQRTLADQVKCYCWKADDGYENVNNWIAHAARVVGR